MKERPKWKDRKKKKKPKRYLWELGTGAEGVRVKQLEVVVGIG